VEVPQRSVADALSRRDVAGSVWRFYRAAQFSVVGTAGAVAAGHQEAFWRIAIPGQEEDVADDQGSAKILTFDLSFPLLKRLITRSQSLYRQVQRDANGASRCQLSVNDQGLVIKWGSRIVARLKTKNCNPYRSVDFMILSMQSMSGCHGPGLQLERVKQTLETYLQHFVSVGLND
jgi:hypothetical protein